MPISLDTLVEEASQLPKEVLGELIDRILIKSHGGMEPEVEDAWKLVIRDRVAEILDGKVEGISLEDSLA